MSTAQQDTGILNANGLVAVADGYQVVSADPQLALRLGSDMASLSQDGRQLLLRLSVINPPHAEQALTGDLFYINDSGASKGFNSFQRLSFEIPANTQSGILFELPDGLTLQSSAALRFDINDCNGCIIDTTGAAKSFPAATMAKITSAALGKVEIPTQGLNLSLEGWVLNDVEGDTSEFIITGGDPYLISPPILAKTENLGGLELILAVEDAKHAVQDFQLFYATEHHGFVESSSSISRTKVVDGTVSLFLPLHFLYQEFPPLNLLERVRLDFAHHGVLAEPTKIEGRWHLMSARLVSRDEFKQAGDITTSTSYANKPQRQSVKQITVGVLTKLMTDKVFIIFYFLLIVMLLIWQITRLRGSQHG